MRLLLQFLDPQLQFRRCKSLLKLIPKRYAFARIVAVEATDVRFPLLQSLHGNVQATHGGRAMRANVVATPNNVSCIRHQVFVHIAAKEHFLFDRNHRIEVDTELACSLAKTRITPLSAAEKANRLSALHATLETVFVWPFMTVKFSQNASRFYIGTMCSRALCRCILANSPPKAACFRDVNDVNNVRCQRCQLRQLRPLSITSMTSTASMTSKHQPRRLRRRLVVRPPAAAVGGTPPAAAGFSDVIDVIDAVDVIDSGHC